MNETKFLVAVSRVRDKPIRYEEITCEALAESLGQARNTYFKEHCKAIVVDLRNGVFAGRNDVLEELTGQRPTTLPEFGNCHRQAFASALAEITRDSRDAT